jgi:hypothetical protein
MKLPLIFNRIIKFGRNFKYRKYPCAKCLVKVTCLEMSTCELYIDHGKYSQVWKGLKEECTELIFITCCFGGFGFVILTAGFGLWKWGEIIYGYFT